MCQKVKSSEPLQQHMHSCTTVASPSGLESELLALRGFNSKASMLVRPAPLTRGREDRTIILEYYCITYDIPAPL